jgi:hypothetical protein
MSLRNTSYFNPTLISGCTLWLDGADPAGNGVVPANGATVSSWADKSGNGLTVSAASSQPTYSTNAANRLGTVSFNGSQSLTAGSVTGEKLIGNSGNCAIFVVMRVNNSPGRSMPFSWDDGNYTARLLVQYDENSILYVDKGAFPDNRTTATISLSTTLYYIFSYSQNGSNTTLKSNGNTIGTLTNFANNSITSSTRIFNVGSYVNGSDWNMKGNTAEIIFFNTHIPNNFQQVEGYLAWKWGLASSLPASHPYSLTPSYALPFIAPNAPAKTTITYANHPVIAAGGCALWLDAADSSTISYSSGSNLSQWRDKSGNGYIMTNNTGTTTVASAELNSYNAIYTPSGTSAKIASFTGRTKFTLFFVGKCAAGKYLLGFNSGFVYAGNDTLMSFTVSGNTFDCVDSIGLTNSVVSANTWFIFSIGYDNVAAFTPNPYNINGSPLNGANRTTITSPYITPSIVTDQYVSNPFYINSLGTNSYDSDYTAEIIFYNTNLNVSQRQNIEGYLAQKWGLTANLPVGHPFKSSFPLFPAPVTGVRRIAGRRWSPLTPGNCVLWLDGADSSTFTLSSTSVTQWRDKSGNSNHMANNGTSPIYNASLINSVGGIDCTNGGGLISSGFQNSANISFAMVAVVKSGLGFWGSFFTHGGRDFDFAVERNSVVGTTIHFQTANDNSSCGIAYTVDAPVLYFGTMTSGTSRFFESFSGGTNTITTGTNSSTISLGSQIVRVGKSDNNEVCNSFIGEIIYYTAVVSTTQRQEIEGYLAWKWGLKDSLPSSHPYKLFPPSP